MAHGFDHCGQFGRIERSAVVRTRKILVEGEMLLYHLRPKSRGSDRHFDSEGMVAVTDSSRVQFTQTVHSLEIDVGIWCGILCRAME